jgi:hypothetical protein
MLPSLLDEFSAARVAHLVDGAASIFDDCHEEKLPARFGILLRTSNGDRSRDEDRSLNSALCRRHTELKLALIELVDNLAHGCLIQIRRSSDWSRGQDGACNWCNRRRHGDESRSAEDGTECYDDTNQPDQPLHTLQ